MRGLVGVCNDRAIPVRISIGITSVGIIGIRIGHNVERVQEEEEGKGKMMEEQRTIKGNAADPNGGKQEEREAATGRG